MPVAVRAGTFSGRVLALFSTAVFGAAIGIVNGILLARFLGPAAKGDYSLLILLPSTAMVFIQLGLPAAFTYYAARGQTAGLVVKSVLLAVALSSAAFAVIILLLPLIHQAFQDEIGLGQVLVVFLALPFALNATFTTGIVMGHRAVRAYAIVKSAAPIVTTGMIIGILGVLGASLNGALAIYLIGTVILAIGFLYGAARLERTKKLGSATYRDLFRYGLPFYPGSLTAFFDYRIDVYLIALLIVDASASLGYYSMAVGLAEFVFFFPNSVSMLYFPQVAGAAREESDQQVAMVTRVTFLMTSGASLLLIPAVAIMIVVLLPDFLPSITPFVVLLPGVVALSSAKVVGSYVAGIGRPGINSWVSIVTLVVNIAANLVLIPLFGIVGAAAASLVSYGFSAVLMTAIAARFTGTRMTSFWIPRPSDIRYVTATSISLVRRVVAGLRAAPDVRGS